MTGNESRVYVTAELEDGAFEECLSRRMDAVSASGGMGEQCEMLQCAFKTKLGCNVKRPS